MGETEGKAYFNGENPAEAMKAALSFIRAALAFRYAPPVPPGEPRVSVTCPPDVGISSSPKNVTAGTRSWLPCAWLPCGCARLRGIATGRGIATATGIVSAAGSAASRLCVVASRASAASASSSGLCSGRWCSYLAGIESSMLKMGYLPQSMAVRAASDRSAAARVMPAAHNICDAKASTCSQ